MERRRDRARRAGSLALVLVLAGCSAIRFTDPYPEIEGSWEGAILAGGTSIAGTLAIERDDSALELVFVAPAFDLRAEGTGTIDEAGGLAVDLTYDLDCPGGATLSGRVSQDGRRLSGTLTATDCTGTVDGTFAFRREQ